ATLNPDVIMPKEFLKGIDRSGLGEGAFHDLRFDSAGRPRDDFVLNQAPWRKTCFLVVGSNFGTGSSREHAVWGLMQLGIRAIIGTSFAGIFLDNSATNALFPMVVTKPTIAPLMERPSNPDRTRFEIDLAKQWIVTKDGLTLSFDIEPARKEALMQGLDAIAATLRYRDEIKDFERNHLDENPWLA